MNWTRKDKNRASALIAKVVKAAGGWQATATELNLSSRQKVRGWEVAGRVPVLHCQAMIELGAKHGIHFTASDVNGDARILENAQKVNK